MHELQYKYVIHRLVRYQTNNYKKYVTILQKLLLKFTKIKIPYNPSSCTISMPTEANEEEESSEAKAQASTKTRFIIDIYM